MIEQKIGHVGDLGNRTVALGGGMDGREVERKREGRVAGAGLENLIGPKT